jgi:hypothetical protein
MPKGPIALASFGLALNLFLWGGPGMIAASGAAHLVVPGAPSLSQALRTLELRTSGTTPSLYESLLKLIGAESEALQVAGAALQQPTPADIGPRANAAGAQVEDAARSYIHAAQALAQR